MSEEIAQRIAQHLKAPNLVDSLATLPGADLHSLLLSVVKRRISRIEPTQLKRPNAVSQASDIDSRLLHDVERAAYASARQFHAVELSPLNPLGALATLTGLDQANALSTVRGFECTSDPTLGLAMECVRRRERQIDRGGFTRLCTSQRVTRFPVPRKPGMTAHFKLFGLLSGARDEGSFSFEVQSLREHLTVYLSFLEALKPLGFAFADTVVEISDTRAVEWLCAKFRIDREEIRAQVKAREPGSSDRVLAQYAKTWPGRISRPLEELVDFELPKHILIQLGKLEKEVCAPLAASYPSIHFGFNMHRLNGLAYYAGPCFQIATANHHGERFSIADGGFVDWTRRLLADEKERALTTAIGMELLCRIFRPDRP